MRFFNGRRSLIVTPVSHKRSANGDGPIIDEAGENTTNPFETVELVEAYAEIAKDFITHAAFTIGGVFAACKIVERICR